MYHKYFSFIILMICITSSGQSKIEKQKKAIEEEGKMLYQSEMASWYGTDIFMERFKEKTSNIGGYFSYTENDISKCIFFSKDEKPKVIGTITFDNTFNVRTAAVDVTERDLTAIESDLQTLRVKTLQEIQQNKDSLFSFYKDTSLNLIPIITKKEKRVFILTGPSKNRVVIFGNDYLLNFNKKNELVSKKKIHKSAIFINYDKNSVGGAHSHLPETGDFITSTDICTLMLYEKFAHWESHYVVSKEFVSIWDCKTDQLTIMKYEDWEKLTDENGKIISK